MNRDCVRPLPEDAARLLETLNDTFPAAVNGGKNALHELDFWRWKRGRYFFGSSSMSIREVRYSARTVLELLAGRLPIEQFLDVHGRDRGWVPLIEQKLRNGQMLVGTRLERVPHEDDDWIVFEFSDWDPATGSIRAEPPTTQTEGGSNARQA